MYDCALKSPLRVTYSTKCRDTSCQRFYDKKPQTHDHVVKDDCAADCIADLNWYRVIYFFHI